MAFFNDVKMCKNYLAIILITTGCINAIFCFQDMICFYIAWEALLVPTTLGIGMWGGKNRSFVATKYFLYNYRFGN